MDDKDLLAAVRQDFAGVRMNTAAEAILTDGSSLRRKRSRRRVYGAGVAALAAVAAVSGVTLASGTSGASGTHDARLTAWTVQKEAGGTIDVTIRDLLNLTGLQRELAADGVPAEVVSNAHYPAACVDRQAMDAGVASVITRSPTRPSGYAFVIHPASIPSGSKLLLDVTRPIPVTSGGATTNVLRSQLLWGFGASRLGGVSVTAEMGLVYARSKC
ncbi:MAG: hypothetical protein JWM19_6823 [Actinomycetia bacterium]|nr:hypothetical protein [Actinomycetes bacterium]